MHENGANIRKHENKFVDLPFEKLVDFRNSDSVDIKMLLD